MKPINVSAFKRHYTSDATWLTRQAEAWESDTRFVHFNQVTPYQEFFDARKEPPGWREAGFDDNRWPTATVLRGRTSDRPPTAGPWAKLVARDIPPMTGTAELPVRIECVEENLELKTRSRINDLAPSLSMVGQPLRYARMDNPENLCLEDGTTIVQCSLGHLDEGFDGIYAPAVVLDFGRVITARARIEIEAVAGCVIEIGYAERLIDGHFNIAIECEFADQYTTRDGKQVFEPFAWKAFRYLKLRFRSCFEPVVVRRVLGMVSTYPYEERGEFRSADETLNAVFGISRTTLRLCSNESLMDTPWREQGQWLGDVALVTVPAIQSCFGDTRLTNKFFQQSGQNQLPTGMLSNMSNAVPKNWLDSIPDYSLWWIKGVLCQFNYTGDEVLLHRLYPQALRVIDAHLDYLNADGLIEDMPFWVFIDWADVGKNGISAAYNAIFHIALGCLGELAAHRGDQYTVDLTARLRGAIQSRFHEVFYDAGRGCYADAVLDGAFSDKISEQSNMAAIAAGLCPPDFVPAIIDRVFVNCAGLRFTEAQPFFMAVVLDALDQAGRFDLALQLIRDRWGKRMVEKGATSTYEEWGQNGSYRFGAFWGLLRTHSHAWSACPADFLIRNLLGLQILEPGCRCIAIAPRETGFDYRVVFPTPHGPLEVEKVGKILKFKAPEAIEIVRA
jgi:alpha-L-rhamnosidase